MSSEKEKRGGSRKGGFCLNTRTENLVEGKTSEQESKDWRGGGKRFIGAIAAAPEKKRDSGCGRKGRASSDLSASERKEG